MNFIPSIHQAAGHDGCLTAGAIFAKQSCVQEIEFYTETTKRLSADQDGFSLMGSALGHWMPTYMGTMSEGFEKVDGAMIYNPANVNPEAIGTLASVGKPYVVLSNLYYRYKHPCILDIKLGSVLTDDTVTPEKKARLKAVSMSTTSGSLSFRICGMKIYGMPVAEESELFPLMKDTMQSQEVEGSNQTYTSFDKYFGRQVDETNVEKALGLFFKANLSLRKQVLERFHQRLQLFYNCLLDTEVRVKSGSLLFIYEGDLDKWVGYNETSYFDADPLVHESLAYDSESEDSGDESLCEIRPESKECTSSLSQMNFIDFAHAKYTEGEGVDDNIIDGVENLIQIFERLIASA